jgi:hypothetical protein
LFFLLAKAHPSRPATRYGGSKFRLRRQSDPAGQTSLRATPPPGSLRFWWLAPTALAGRPAAPILAANCLAAGREMPGPRKLLAIGRDLLLILVPLAGSLYFMVSPDAFDAFLNRLMTLLR